MLWDGLIGAWAPSLGYQDPLLIELSGRGPDMTSKNGAPLLTSVGNSLGKFALECTSSDSVYSGSWDTGIGTGAYTVHVRVVVESAANSRGVAGFGAFSPGFYSETSGGGGATWGIYDGGFVNANTTLVWGADLHEYALTVSRSGSTVSFFLDGVADGSGSSSGSVSTSGFGIGRGGTTSGAYAIDSILEVYVYDRALSLGEISMLAATPLAPFYEKRQRVFMVPAAAPGGVTVPALDEGMLVGGMQSLSGGLE